MFPSWMFYWGLNPYNWYGLLFLALGFLLLWISYSLPIGLGIAVILLSISAFTISIILSVINIYKLTTNK